MMRYRWLLVCVLLFFLAVGVLAADGRDHFSNGLQSIYYFSVRIDQRFSNIVPLRTAVHEFREAIAGGQDVDESRAMLALVLSAQGELDDALHEYASLVSENPDAGWIAAMQGDVYRRAGDFERAAEKYEEALVTEDFARAHMGLARIALIEDRTADAVERLVIVVELAPDLVDAQFELGRIRFSEGDYEAALEHFQVANNFEPRDAEIHYYLGRVYEAQDKDEQAAYAFDRVQQLDPDFATEKLHEE